MVSTILLTSAAWNTVGEINVCVIWLLHSYKLTVYIMAQDKNKCQRLRHLPCDRTNLSLKVVFKKRKQSENLWF